ncbi:uncharacterized protein LOC123721585 [Papilio machaon]|uniref:uncharacterized protein LOC123721585 n=1 Tax=Papilio machaon TaxID=76193 RepID=UPI001E664DB6|nr:uncharacterized protein LOC123721585 [Papilio machaon]
MAPSVSILQANGAPAVTPDRPLPGEGPRWKVSTLDPELAKEAAIVERWGANGTLDGLDTDARCERLAGALTRVCDAAMRRAGPALPRTRVYWWRPHLAGLRTACQVARRTYTRSRRRSRRDLDQEALLLAAYRAARAALT